MGRTRGGPRPFRGPNYRRGYTGRDFHVTGGHEAEAEAAERAKKPNRFGMWVLRLLGFRGNVGDPTVGTRTITSREPDEGGGSGQLEAK